MADYSEFPTTPTAWQEAALRDAGWPEATPLAPAYPAPPRHRRFDAVSLVAGLVFVALAVLLMSGVQVSFPLFRGGGVLWAVLIGLGVLLLVGEARRRR